MTEKCSEVIETSDADKTERIQKMNDVFRTTFLGGQVLMTQGIQALGEIAIQEVMSQVQRFNSFTSDNDPHGEHDFGAFEHDGQKVFWKIDYYDKSMTYGSENPSDPAKTTRVLTVMLAEEY